MNLICKRGKMIMVAWIFLLGYFLFIHNSYAEQRNINEPKILSDYVPYLICVSDVAIINGCDYIFLNAKFKSNFGAVFNAQCSLNDFIEKYRDITGRIKITDSLLIDPISHMSTADFFICHPKIIKDNRTYWLFR